MSSIFSTKDKEVKRQYRDSLSRLIEILQYLRVNRNTSTWRLSCVLHTSVQSIDNMLEIAMRHGIVDTTLDGRKYNITSKGKDFLKVIEA